MSTSPLPLALLDFVGIEHGESASAALRGAVGIAQAVEVVAVTPSLDRGRRTASLVALADAWRAVA